MGGFFDESLKNCKQLAMRAPVVPSVELEPVSQSVREITHLRSYGTQLGKKLSSESEIGDIIASVLTVEGGGICDAEPFMLCKVLSNVYTVKEDFESFCGNFEGGVDVVLDIQKYEPVSAGSSVFTPTDKRFPIYVDDVRLGKIELLQRKVRRSARCSTSTLSADSRSEDFILQDDDKSQIIHNMQSDT